MPAKVRIRSDDVLSDFWGKLRKVSFDFVRRDGSAQIWQYRATNCILDLFLYQAGSETKVKHAELRSRVPGAETLDVCYSRMRHERKTKPSG